METHARQSCCVTQVARVRNISFCQAQLLPETSPAHSQNRKQNLTFRALRPQRLRNGRDIRVGSPCRCEDKLEGRRRSLLFCGCWLARPPSARTRLRGRSAESSKT